MKRLFLFLLCLGALALTSCKKDDSEAGPAFPDANFREYLVSIGFEETNGDIDPNNEINKALFAKSTKLFLRGINGVAIRFYSLKGIEFFTELTDLNCSCNGIRKLDLSKNTKLVNLDCGMSLISELKLPASTKLIAINCEYNMLTSLDTSKASALKSLHCKYNQLSELIISGSTELEVLACDENQLTTLDVSNNTKLHYLNCYRNQLSTLDISMLSRFSQSDELLCGNQQPDKELTLRLTSVQNNYLKDFDQRAENVRVKKVIVD